MKTMVGAYLGRIRDSGRTLSAAVRHWRRTVLLGGLLTGALLVGMPVGAWAASPEMRGEWALTLTVGPNTVKATSFITQQANASGEFASSSLLWERVIPGSFSGTLGTTEASVKVTGEAYGSYPPFEFTSSSMEIHSGSSLSLSGSGTVTRGTETSPGTLTATQVRTQKQIEEQVAREKREHEEAEARANVRGEWSLVLESGSQTAHGTARITEAANAKNEFTSSSVLFEGAISGTFSGTLSLEAGKTSVTLTSEGAGSIPPGKFTSTTVTVESVAGGMSMSGSGTLTIEAGPGNEITVPATFSATRVKSYTELKEAESQEATEREAKERSAREAQEALEREAREKLEREARERLEREAAQLTVQAPPTSTTPGVTVTSPVQPIARLLAVGASGSLSLQLGNPNALAVKGHVTLLFTGEGAGKVAASKHRRPGKRVSIVLGSASFSISPGGRTTVRMELSRAGRALLAHHKTLSAVAKIVTQTGAEGNVSKTYRLTLRAASRSPHHH